MRTHLLPSLAPSTRRAAAAFLLGALPFALLSAASACSERSEPRVLEPRRDARTDASAPTGPAAMTIVPGVSIGRARLGMRYAEVRQQLGPLEGNGFNGLILAPFGAEKMELVFSSSEATGLNDDSVVIALGALAPSPFVGSAMPGMRRAAIEAALGKPATVASNVHLYASGIGVVYDSPDAPDATVTQISVFAPFVVESAPPEMRPSQGPQISAPPILEGVAGKIVDMHLHPGSFGRTPGATSAVFVGSTPAFVRPYAPAAFGQALAPFAPHLGIRAQTDLAKVDHAVLFAVYTHKTTGFETNEEVEALLTDPRNRAQDGLPWAWGLASINFFDGYVAGSGVVDTAISTQRLAALASYFERRRDLFIGIKLAHAHQNMAFDDVRYLGVYEVAKRFGVPVYLHTGVSPFPGAATALEFCDPSGLANVIQNTPSVRFILGHVAQGDAGSVERALEMAVKHPNVYLEISALKRPATKGSSDAGPSENKGEYPYILEQIKARGLVSKTIFGSDGPQFAGMVKSYKDAIVKTMEEKGYTPAEIAKVMGENFFDVFFR